MGKASSSKKVARAARTGGGRTRRGAGSWVWPVLMSFVVVLGTAGIVYSREQRQPDTSRPHAGGEQRGDHWHAAIGFNLCGTFAGNIQSENDPLGIHTHGDGVVHVHPFSSTAAGRRATLGVFFETVDAKVTRSEIKLPGQDAKKAGDKCGDKPGEVQVKVWDSRSPEDQGRVVRGDPGDIRLRDNQLITIAFLPDGAEIPKPPSESQLDNLTDVPGATTSPPVGAPTPTPGPDAGTPPTELPPTTAAGATPDTTAPASTSPPTSTAPPPPPG